MSARRAKPPERYAAKLLFQFRVTADGESNRRRLCEERIVLIEADSPASALATAKRRGRAGKHRYKNPAGDAVHFEFVGVMDLMHLGVECEPGEVWYEMRERVEPMERRSRTLPTDEQLLGRMLE